MSPPTPELCLVVPCFNEEDRWDHDYWVQLVTNIPCTLVFVDDGSTDGTIGQLRSTADAIGASVVSMATNAGKGEAVRRGLLYGLEKANPKIIGFIDADGAFSADEPRRLVEKLTEINSSDPSVCSIWGSRAMLIGRRITRDPKRHYLGRVLATRVFAGVHDAPYDSQCGLKLFISSDELMEILAEPFVTRWLFDVEIFARLRGHGLRYRIWEEPVLEWRETNGSKVTTREMVRIFWESRTVRRVLSGAA